MSATLDNEVRHNWNKAEVQALFDLPFNDLMFQAQTVHRQHFNPNEVQVSTLLSIKTGSCPEDCKYCPQSAHYNTGLEKQRLMEVEAVLNKAARCLIKPLKPKPKALAVSAWAPPGKTQINVTCLMY